MSCKVLRVDDRACAYLHDVETEILNNAEDLNDVMYGHTRANEKICLPNSQFKGRGARKVAPTLL